LHTRRDIVLYAGAATAAALFAASPLKALASVAPAALSQNGRATLAAVAGALQKSPALGDVTISPERVIDRVATMYTVLDTEQQVAIEDVLSAARGLATAQLKPSDAAIQLSSLRASIRRAEIGADRSGVDRRVRSAVALVFAGVTPPFDYWQPPIEAI
jgi:hypothetical protein